jgi:hypothetical protein
MTNDVFGGMFDFIGQLFGPAVPAGQETLSWNHDGTLNTSPQASPGGPVYHPASGLDRLASTAVATAATPAASTGPVERAVQSERGPRVKSSDDGNIWTPDKPANTTPKAAVSGKSGSKPGTWTTTNKTWLGMDEHQRTAAMSLLEVNDVRDTKAAKNVSAAIVNRARQRGFDLGAHVSSRTYQPTFMSNQESRLEGIVKSPQFNEVLSWVKRYDGGHEADPTNGATHYIAHGPSMAKLSRDNPKLYPYKNWASWSGYDPAIKDYRNKLAQDASHAFLAPDPVGRFSVTQKGKAVDRLPEIAIEPLKNPDDPTLVKTMRVDPRTGNITE